MSERQPCRVCGKRVYVRQDGMVSLHGSCPGSLRPPEGETPCTVYCPTAGRVSRPEDVASAVGTSMAMASTYVCANPEHQKEAVRWVESVTGHRGVFVEFKRRAVSANAR